MTKIIYTLLAEGIVENEFIPGLLKKLSTNKNITISKSSLSLKQSSGPSKSKVLKNVNLFAKSSILINDENLFLVGVDLDSADHDLSQLKEQEKQIRALIPNGIDEKKAIIFIPIQSFDHWLLYQHYKVNRSEKTLANSLESKLSSEVKKTLYGVSNPNGYLIKTTTKKVLEVLDIQELSKQSKSFKHFYDQLPNILKPQL